MLSVSTPPRREPTPRLTPGTRRDIGLVNAVIARVAGVATGGAPPNLFTTLGRHRKLFRRWLPFAGALMPGGLLDRADTELVILRVAHLTGCDYEREHHEPIARHAGLAEEQVRAAEVGADAGCWSERQVAVLRAVDELHGQRTLSDAAWAGLRPHYSDAELLELCVLTGHYEMLAMVLNAARVAPDATPARPPRVLRLVQRLAGRRRKGRRS